MAGCEEPGGDHAARSREVEQARLDLAVELRHGRPARVLARRLALALIAADEPEEAEILLRRLLSEAAEAGPEKLPGLPEFHDLLNLLESKGDFGEAAEMQRRSVRHRMSTLRVGHPDIPRGVHHLGRLLRLAGLHDEAVEAFNEAIRLWKISCGGDGGHIFARNIAEAESAIAECRETPNRRT